MPLSRYKKAILITTAMVVLGFGAWFVLRDYFFLPFDNRNFAEETAKPIAQKLIELGAVEKCGFGDDGRRADNRSPWYGYDLEFPANRQEALRALEQAFAASGYKATHATPENRSGLAATDDDISNYYFDSSKASPYRSLGDGQVRLSAKLLNDGDHDYPCGMDANGVKTVKMYGGDKQTIVSIGVRLPGFK